MKSNNEKYSKILLSNCLTNYRKIYYVKSNTMLSNHCMNYIKKYFIDFEKKFNDTNIKKILLCSELETKIIRTKYGVYNNGINQSNEEICKQLEINATELTRINEKMNRIIWEDLSYKLKYLITELTQGNTNVLNEKIIGIGELGIKPSTYSLLRKNNIPGTVQELTKMTQLEIKRILGIETKESNDIIEKIHEIGYTFLDEINLENEEELQESESEGTNNELYKKINELKKNQQQMKKLEEESIILTFEIKKMLNENQTKTKK